MFFTNGGAEANENAMRMARLHTGRHKVLADLPQLPRRDRRRDHADRRPAPLAVRAGHARRRALLGALPLPLGVPRRPPRQEECERALAAPARRRSWSRAPHTVAAIILETVVGTNGILVPPDGYLAGVRALCDEHGIVMIADEVMAGFGRCGEWFAVDHWGVTPDLITFAKGVNSGYVPLGGVVISDPIAATFADRPYPGGLTYSGHPLACASAVASINIFQEEGIIEHARAARHRRHRARACASWPSGTRPSARCAASASSGRSSWCATARPASRSCRSTPRARPPRRWASSLAACKSRGLWPFTHFNRTHVVPPCTTTADEIREGLAVLDEALEVADKYYTGS